VESLLDLVVIKFFLKLMHVYLLDLRINFFLNLGFLSIGYTLVVLLNGYSILFDEFFRLWAIDMEFLQLILIFK
jgi:hypothetical protein